MIKEIIDIIPSKDLRKFLNEHPINLSPLQQATIVSEFANKEEKISVFRKLKKLTENKEEQELFSKAISEIEKFGYFDRNTLEFYKKNFSKGGLPPFSPFLEVCYVPILFKKGDVISYNGEFFYVEDIPNICEVCDFSDECYLCYSLSKKVENKEDLFVAHKHIHVCVAQTVSLESLSKEQKENKERMETLLS